MIAHARKDYLRAKELYREAIEIMELMGEKFTKACALEYLGLLAKDEGNLSEAEVYAEQAVATSREMNLRGPAVYRLAVLGQIYFLQGNMEQAKKIFGESLILGMSLHLRVVAISLIYICTYLAVSAPRQAIQILSAIHSYEGREKSALARDPFDEADFEEALARARLKLGKSVFRTAWAEGENMSIEEACDLAFKMLEEM